VRTAPGLHDLAGVVHADARRLAYGINGRKLDTAALLEQRVGGGHDAGWNIGIDVHEAPSHRKNIILITGADLEAYQAVVMAIIRVVVGILFLLL